MKKTILLFAAAAVLLAVGCSEINEVSTVSEQDPVEIMPLNGPSTRAAIDGTTFPEARTLIVSAYYNAVRGDSQNYFANSTFARNASGKWSCSGGAKYWPLRGTLDLFAYSIDGLSQSNQAYLSNNAQGVSFNISNNGTQQTDILYGRVTAASRVAAGNPMTMKHAQALIVFTAQSNVAYNATNNYGITITSIVLENAYYSGKLAIDGSAAAGSQCTWSSLGNQQNKTLPTVSSGDTKIPYNVPASAPAITASGWHMGIGGYGILVPEQNQTRFYITYVLHNGKDNSGNNVDNTLTYQYDCSGTWDEGKKYIYAISFTLNEIIVVPSVTDWTASTVATNI